MHPSDFGFNYPEFRDCQLQALEWTQQGTKAVRMLEAAPGVGKSLIGACWGLMSGGNGYILTRTLSLLRQYETQLGLPIIRGAENFTCEPWSRRSGRPVNCDDAMSSCAWRGTMDCPYSAQRAEGHITPLAATSYAYILADGKARNGSDYLVCDEGHNLLDVLTDFQSIAIPWDLKPPEQLDALPAWAKLKLPKHQGHEPDPESDPVAHRRWQKIEKALERLARANLTDALYVLTKTSKSLVMKPVWPEANTLWRKRTLIMSATLFGGGFFADLFNLAPGNWDFTSIPSPFDVARRPLFLRPTVTLNYRSTADDYTAMGRTILWLIEHYPQEKGLLHVTSYKQVNMLQSAFQALGATPPILYHTGQRRDERTRLFDHFRKHPGPLWLLSPSTREGEDFPHDQARVNVIVKIPYPDLCYDDNMRILTTDLRWVPARGVRVGDELIGIDENVAGPQQQRRLRRSVVTSVSRVRLPVYKVSLSDGTVLRCSGEHPWLVKCGRGQAWRLQWRLTRDLAHKRYRDGRPTKAPVTIRMTKLCDLWEEDTTREGGYLAGLLDGEGNLTASAVLGFAQVPGEVLAEYLALMRTRGFHVRVHPKQKGHSAYSASVSSIPETLRALGSLRPRRLLRDSAKAWEGRYLPKGQDVWVDNVVEDGVGDLIGIGTTTHTMVAEGFFTHNSDPIIAARREDGARGKAYYAAVTCGSLAQAYGRGMRADGDWGHSWILDKGIFNLLKYNRDFLPTYVKEAIQSG